MGRLCRLLVLSSLALLAVPAAASAGPLRGWWSMYEGRGQVVHDLSGEGNHGRVGRTDGTDSRDPEWVRGVLGIGSALRFDGNDFVAMPDTGSLRPQRVTVMAWARADAPQGEHRYLVSKGGDRCEAGSFGLYTSANGGAAFYVYDGRRWWRSPEASPAIWDGRWHHLAGVYDGSRVRLYVDGVQVGRGREFDGRIDYDLPRRDFSIGAYRGACDLTFRGDIDEVALWTDDLSRGAIRSSLRDALPTPSLLDLWRAYAR